MFKNISMYRFNRPFAIDMEKFQAELSEFAFSPCEYSEMSKMGWVPPVPNGTELFHKLDSDILLKLRVDTKSIPAPPVNQETNRRVAIMEAEEDRKLARKERAVIKEEIVLQQIPTCLPSTTIFYAMIYFSRGLLVTNCNSKHSEVLMGLLRKTIGSLPVVPVGCKENPSHIMTEWAKVDEDSDKVPEQFSLRDKFTLENDSEGRVVGTNQDITDEEYQSHIATGMWAVSLSLNFGQTATLDIKDNLYISNFKLTDTYKVENESEIGTEAADVFDADAFLMHRTVAEIVDYVITSFGGLDEFL